MDARLFRLVAGVSLIVLTGCNEQVPSNPLSATSAPVVVPAPVVLATVSGTVWVHEASGVRPEANARILARVQQPTHDYSTPVPTDASGRFSFAVRQGAEVRLQGTVRESFQPCQVVLRANAEVAADIHVVVDRQQLGANIPAALRAHVPLLSGVVFEQASDGRRLPLADAYISLDGLAGGVGWLAATTLTDAEGRYVLCGLADEPSTYLFVSKTGYSPFESSVKLIGNTTLDIELRR